jgi:hypothetical protein
MSPTMIIADLDTEIARLEQVKKLFPNERNVQLGNLAANESASRRKRTLSPEGRRKIAEAQ